MREFTYRRTVSFPSHRTEQMTNAKGAALSSDYFHSMAMRCRSLANSITDRRTIDALLALARECDEKAAEADAGPVADPKPQPSAD